MDDVRIEDHADVPVPALYDRLNTNLAAWLDGGWTLSTNAYAGSGSASDLDEKRIPPDSYRVLTFASSIDLAGVADPMLTYWNKGRLLNRARFRTQI